MESMKQKGKIYYFDTNSGELISIVYELEESSQITVNRMVRYYSPLDKKYPRDIYVSKMATDIESFC